MLSDHELDQIEDDLQHNIAMLRDDWPEHGDDPDGNRIEDDDMVRRFPRAGKHAKMGRSRAPSAPRSLHPKSGYSTGFDQAKLCALTSGLLLGELRSRDDPDDQE
jgi:hypothetical protein